MELFNAKKVCIKCTLSSVLIIKIAWAEDYANSSQKLSVEKNQEFMHFLKFVKKHKKLPPTTMTIIFKQYNQKTIESNK
jgi:hypothetical protein